MKKTAIALILASFAIASAPGFAAPAATPTPEQAAKKQAMNAAPKAKANTAKNAHHGKAAAKKHKHKKAPKALSNRCSKQSAKKRHR